MPPEAVFYGPKGTFIAAHETRMISAHGFHAGHPAHIVGIVHDLFLLELFE
jgi:hypothetical protein